MIFSQIFDDFRVDDFVGVVSVDEVRVAKVVERNFEVDNEIR
jgi:hypothetical protein